MAPVAVLGVLAYVYWRMHVLYMYVCMDVCMYGCMDVWMYIDYLSICC